VTASTELKRRALHDIRQFTYCIHHTYRELDAPGIDRPPRVFLARKLTKLGQTHSACLAEAEGGVHDIRNGASAPKPDLISVSQSERLAGWGTLSIVQM
jgi:hypothetical protein